MRTLLLGVLLSSSCTLLFGALTPSPCEQGQAPRCEGNSLILCQEGFTVEQDCGTAVCDPAGGRCALCGDGVLDEGEACDDGNNSAGDGCDPDCQSEAPFCGDGLLNENEICDDGNNQSGDGCRSDCLGQEVCGDGLLDVNEECDDGNNQSGDGCEENCTFSCGSGVVADGRVFDAQSGQCYLQFKGPLDWFDARDDCEILGGHLATITSNEENQLVRSIAPGNVWIGMNDFVEEGIFAWITGEAVTFDDFRPGQPDDAQSQDCVLSRVDGWDDNDCPDQGAYVCEIESPGGD